MFLRWAPIIFSAMYDDMALSVYLSTKEHLAKRLNVTEVDIYYSGTIYASGFLLGGFFWNVMARCMSVKRLLLISQIMMIIFTILQIFQVTVWQMYLIRFMQGVSASGAFIGINILAKHNLSQSNFDQFLALDSIFVYFLEAALPVVIGFINDYSVMFSIGLFVVILLISLMTSFLNFKDVNEKMSIKKAVMKSSMSYWELLSSRLLLMILIVGFTEGMVDTLFNVFDKIASNAGIGDMSKLKNISISVISLFSSASIIAIPFFSKDAVESTNTRKKFDWRHVNLKDGRLIFWIGVFSLALFLSSLTPLTNGYIWTMATIIGIMCVLCIVHYIGIKTMHGVYYDSGCVASVILLVETFCSAVMQGLSLFLAKCDDNRLIFGYAFIYIAVIMVFAYLFFKQEGFRAIRGVDSK